MSAPPPPPSASRVVRAAHGGPGRLAAVAVAGLGLAAGGRALYLASAARRFAGLRGPRFGARRRTGGPHDAGRPRTVARTTRVGPERWPA